MYTAQTLNELYRHHISESLAERETIQEAQRLFPYTWTAIYSLMNNTIREKERKRL